uniref:Uncharacterized protein n=1 Tax=Myoviridae sp. ct0e511 TaxID=2825013 RepID=A0A8S5QIW8_9CAUD|nr:MAG TPA: hypothetical protein [Myoviridae sp. ct0e511]
MNYQRFTLSNTYHTVVRFVFMPIAGHMVLRSLYNSGCTTIPIARSQRSPGCTFAVF